MTGTDFRSIMKLFEDTVSGQDIILAKLTSQVSSAIIRERLRLQMTQGEFAKHIGVGQSQVSRWESGDYNFSLNKIAEIASALNLSVDIDITNTKFNRMHPTPVPYSFVSKNNYSSSASAYSKSSSLTARTEDIKYA